MYEKKVFRVVYTKNRVPYARVDQETLDFIQILIRIENIGYPFVFKKIFFFLLVQSSLIQTPNLRF